MTYFRATFLLAIYLFAIFSLPTQAIPIDPCMERKCIVYFNKWKTMASAKRVSALSALAELYYQGYGTEKSLTKSIRYFKKASRRQFTYAQYRTGVFYLMEKDFINYEEGIKFLRRAASNGHTESAFLLALIFGTGELGIKDVGESDKWLEKALINKHIAAQQYANYLYKNGQVDEGHYVKVNKFISDITVIISETDNKQRLVANNITDIQWPVDSDKEGTPADVSSLENTFDYKQTALTVAPLATNLAADTQTNEKECDKIFSCYQVDNNNFWRYTYSQSGGLRQ